ncbi:MAG: PadR family transcriptional regulator [Acidobacteriota bacterium]|nr:PadR family transcriptional regulator [Acidobacteriota bacterium]
MTRRSSNPNFLNGVPELLILTLLADSEMYGYELVQAIRERTAGVVAAGEGVVYPVLHALEAEGAVTSRRRVTGGRSRIYYSLTNAGRTRMGEMATSWMTLTEAVRSLVQGRRQDETAMG